MLSSKIFYLALIGLLCTAVYSHSAEHDPHEDCVKDPLNMADDMVKGAQEGLKCAGKKVDYDDARNGKHHSEEDHHHHEEDHESFLKRSIHEAEDLTLKAAETAQKVVKNPVVRTSTGFLGEIFIRSTSFVMNVIRAMSRDEVA